MSLDDEWDAFLDDDNVDDEIQINVKDNNIKKEDCPIPSELYISTKTEIAFLDSEINIQEKFWNIILINYDENKCGVIKKQMKFISESEEEYNQLKEKLKDYKDNYIEENVMSAIRADIGTKIFKDTRKISIGISKKDMIANRQKKKGAFYNCFVLILRINENDKFKEYHVKIFNTGKVELPGIQTTKSLVIIKEHILKALNTNNHSYNFIDKTLKNLNPNESILINSNFDCGFYLDRIVLFEILQTKYKLNCIYDACTYPGVRCKFYYSNEITDGRQNSDDDKSVSFMIFRTGSVLIVGKCNEDNLYKIYNFIKQMLIDEYSKIFVCNNNNRKKEIQEKKVKKTIEIKS